MDKIEHLEKEIAKLKERNLRVEKDKAWETGFQRKVIIACMTYLLIGIYMSYLEVAKPWLNALVPTTGYILSTLTISWAKLYWMNKNLK